MSRIKSINTIPEVFVRTLLHNISSGSDLIVELEAAGSDQAKLLKQWKNAVKKR